MIEFERIDHIHICIPEERLQEALLFYTEVIGLQLIDRPPVFSKPGYWLAVAGIELHIGVEPALPRTSRHSAFEVKNVQAAKAYLASKNVEIIPETVIPGRQRFAFYDPFGNRMEFLEFDSN